jgi:D-aminopeptidase
MAFPLFAQKPRARDIGIPFNGTPGPLNAITDVRGVEVGHVTLISGEGKLTRGKGPVRTGVTAILPKGKDAVGERVFAAWTALNGNGEMTGAAWVEESGHLGTPILITNTHSVGTVRDAVIEWNANRSTGEGYSGDFSLPLVTETWDGFLNDINGFHVRKEHAFQALENAKGGPVAEGNVGGGTGMVTHRFKGGIGTSSRVAGDYTVGVLVQANYGRRELLTIAGVPVGREIPDLLPKRGAPDDGTGSIIVVIATDAPLLPHQLKRLARRAALGIGVVGGRGENTSGDLMIAFSTANPENSKIEGVATVRMLPNERINPLLVATVDATEEAIVNALIAAETMTGIDGNTVYALPHDRLREILRRHGRLNEGPRVVTLRGSPYERGRIHGSTLRAQIRDFAALWKADITSNFGDADQFVSDFLRNTEFTTAARRWTPDVLEEVRGIADGSELPFDTVLAMQLLDELWWYGAQQKDSNRCSSIGVAKSGDRPAYVAQNMDLEKFRDGYQVVLRIEPDRGPKQLIFTNAGLVALNGVNDRSIGVVVNTLAQLNTSRKGLPVAFVIRGILDQPSEADAIQFVTSVPHASGQNYIIGARDKVHDFEASAGRVARMEPAPVVYHTNHPLVNDDYGPNREHGSNSAARYDFLKRRITVAPSLDDTISALRSRDSEFAICRRLDDSGSIYTFGSTIMILGDEPTLRATAGPPDQAEYVTYGF